MRWQLGLPQQSIGGPGRHKTATWHGSPIAVLGLGCLAGTGAAQQARELWSLSWNLALAAMLLGAWAARHRHPRISLGVVAGVLAVLWSHLLAWTAMQYRIPPDLEGVDLRVTGVVVSMPQIVSQGQILRIRVEHCERLEPVADAVPCPTGGLMRIAWNHGIFSFSTDDPPVGKALPTGDMRPPLQARVEVRAAERWLFKVRLKRPRATVNPGLYDLERRFLEEGIGALASVRHSQAQRLDAWVWHAGALLERLRQFLRTRVLSGLDDVNLGSVDARQVVLALALGDQAAVDSVWWERFNRTGIAHLMSISGLHVTLLAALVAAVIRRLWVYPRGPKFQGLGLAAWIPATNAAWVVAIVVSFAYSLIAGWGIPAQRTCWMILVVGLARTWSRPLRAVDSLLAAAVVVVLVDPWAILAPGFWLSFVGVVILVWQGQSAFRPEQAAPSIRGLTMRQQLHTIRRFAHDLFRTQWAASLGLLPLCAWFFASVSVIGPVLNLFAVPWISGVVTPLALIGLVLQGLGLPGQWLLGLAAVLIDPLLTLTVWCDQHAWASLITSKPSPTVMLLSMAGCLLALAPVGWPGKCLAFLAVLPLLMGARTGYLPEGLRISALDIGQGMAVVIETPEHVLLYDTGPGAGHGNDAGQRTVAPWLRMQGIQRLGAMVVSHQDLDHSGGALSILRQIPVDWVASSLRPDHPIIAQSARHYGCQRSHLWRWGEVEFEWLHPDLEEPLPRRSPTNARSCVLMIQYAGRRILLAGDIEAGQEKALVARYGHKLQADILLAPHHGSNTSSTELFLDTVAPKYAVFQVGYRNRYKHPSRRVMERYRARGIEVLRTDASGAIQFEVTPGGSIALTLARDALGRYWHIDLEPGTEKNLTELSSPRQ